MIRAVRWLALVLPWASTMACAPIPPPAALGEVDGIRVSPASQEAKRYAPSAFAYAEQLRRRAHQALETDDHASAQLLAERANAAYARAAALARVARAEEVRVTSVGEADAAAKQVAELEAEHQRVAADIAALDRRVRVLRDAEPIRPSGDAKPERERARREAVTTMRLQARLLCASATLLSEPITAERKAPTELAEALEQLAALDAALAEGPAAVPIDGAMRARAACLRALTAVRSRAPAAAGTGPDALLEALSKAGHGAPRRDDRGVVVTLRHVFAGDGLSAKGRAALSAVAQVAKAHADVPLMLVLHQSKPLDDKAEKRWQDRAGILSQALSSAGARVGRVEMAGAAAPLVDPRGRHRARNERVELVFVARKPL